MSAKPTIMLIVPWLEVGGADAIGYTLVEALANEFDFGIVTTLPGDHRLENQLAANTQWIEHAARQSALSTNAFLKSTAERYNVQAVLVNWCAAGYEALPQIKSLGRIRTFGIIHNTAPEAWLRHAVLFDPFIDHHFAVGPAQADALLKGASISPSKVTLAANGIDAEQRFNPATYSDQLPELRAEFAVAEDETAIAFIGRLSPEKDCPLFIQSIAEIAKRDPTLSVKALIAGDGAERAEVEREIKRNQLEERISILGFTDRIPELLAVSDYLFLTSKVEGSPLVVLEAMAMETIPIATDVGTVAQVTPRALITNDRSASSFADSFEQASRQPPSLASELRESVRKRFSHSQMIEAYATVLRRELGV